MKTIQDIIDNSGYPLQLHLEEIINNPLQSHGWRVLVKEHRWVNQHTNDEGFIDLVLKHESIRARLVIECKRIGGSWTFLLPTNDKNHEAQMRILKADFETNRSFWCNSGLYPRTYMASFCVPETGGAKDTRTIERIAGDLLLSLESLAIEETDIRKKYPRQNTVFPFLRCFTYRLL